MEFFTILLASLLAAVSPAGLIVDKIVQNSLGDRVVSTERLAVRIDNSPSYQILQGKVERVRIASRDVEILPNLNIAVLELETDPIAVDRQTLQQGEFRGALSQPLQAGLRLIVTEADLNHALRSADFQSRLQQLIERLSAGGAAAVARRYTLENLAVDFADRRLAVELQLQRVNGEDATPLSISLTSGLELVAGRRLRLVDPAGTFNGRPLSKRLLSGLAEGLSERLDLRLLEKQGITARLLQLEVTNEEIHLAAFIQVAPAPANERQTNSQL